MVTLRPYIRISKHSKYFFLSPQVITIFSASNYYEIGSNKGAYLKLNPQLDTHFVQYTAAASKTRKLTFRQKVGLVESSAIRELGAKLRERRHELDREFKARDPDARGDYRLIYTHIHKIFEIIFFYRIITLYFFFSMTGILTMSRWCEAMEVATGLGLPWRLLREKLAPIQPGFPPLDVHYNLTLDLLDTDLIVRIFDAYSILRGANH